MKNCNSDITLGRRMKHYRKIESEDNFKAQQYKIELIEVIGRTAKSFRYRTKNKLLKLHWSGWGKTGVFVEPLRGEDKLSKWKDVNVIPS